MLGPLKRYLVDRDQDTSLVLGQGTRAGLYQSIMQKPLNIRYVYPMIRMRPVVDLPENLRNKELIVVFNIESDRPDDLMYEEIYVAKLHTVVRTILEQVDGVGVLVLIPSTMSEVFSGDFRETFKNNYEVISLTDQGPFTYRFQNPVNLEQRFIWVSSCT